MNHDRFGGRCLPKVLAVSSLLAANVVAAPMAQATDPVFTFTTDRCWQLTKMVEEVNHGQVQLVYEEVFGNLTAKGIKLADATFTLELSSGYDISVFRNIALDWDPATGALERSSFIPMVGHNWRKQAAKIFGHWSKKVVGNLHIRNPKIGLDTKIGLSGTQAKNCIADDYSKSFKSHVLAYRPGKGFPSVAPVGHGKHDDNVENPGPHHGSDDSSSKAGVIGGIVVTVLGLIGAAVSWVMTHTVVIPPSVIFLPR